MKRTYTGVSSDLDKQAAARGEMGVQ